MPFGSSRKNRGWGTGINYQLLVYADDLNILGDKVNTIKENTGPLSDESKEVGLEVNPKKTNYMLCLVTRMQDKFKT
jgi:hypothetical protein